MTPATDHADEQARRARPAGGEEGAGSSRPMVIQPAGGVLRHAAAQMDVDFRHGRFEWDAMLRWYRREKQKLATPAT